MNTFNPGDPVGYRVKHLAGYSWVTGLVKQHNKLGNVTLLIARGDEITVPAGILTKLKTVDEDLVEVPA